VGVVHPDILPHQRPRRCSVPIVRARSRFCRRIGRSTVAAAAPIPAGTPFPRPRVEQKGLHRPRAGEVPAKLRSGKVSIDQWLEAQKDSVIQKNLQTKLLVLRIPQEFLA